MNYAARNPSEQLLQLVNVMTDSSPRETELEVVSYQVVQALWDLLPSLQVCVVQMTMSLL